MELSKERFDEMMEISDHKTLDEMMEWIEIQPDKDLINEFLDGAYAVFSSKPTRKDLNGDLNAKP